MNKSRMLLVSIFCLLAAACASVLPMSDREKCEALIDETWQMLTVAKPDNIETAWEFTKASKFLAQAKVKYETERYELCIDRAKQAQELLLQLKNR